MSVTGLVERPLDVDVTELIGMFALEARPAPQPSPLPGFPCQSSAPSSQLRTATCCRIWRVAVELTRGAWRIVALHGVAHRWRWHDNYTVQERLYRHRCVEAWSIAVPWAGFPLAKLLDVVRARHPPALPSSQPFPHPPLHCSRLQPPSFRGSKPRGGRRHKRFA